MPDDSKKIDKYISEAGEFAQPIMEKIRKAVQKGCPKVEEAIKWGCPYFMYNSKLLCGMAAFKSHVGFGFWRSKELDDPEELFASGTGKKASMCNANFKSLKELPTQKVLVDYVRRATQLEKNHPASKSTATPKRKKVVVPRIPPSFAQAIGKNKKAQTFFDSLAPSHQRDYIEWITSAKREATTEKRIAEAVSLLKEGKRRNWKYENC